MHGDRYFCFTIFQDNEQEEPGDTLTHTFLKYEWAICEDIYFYFWGLVGATTCQSTTAIFKLHRKEIEMYVISLGKFTEEEVLHGEVKLLEGTGIRITRNDAKNALEIETPASATFLGLIDTPASYAGKPHQVVRVNSAQNALEFASLFGFGNSWLWYASDGSPLPIGTFIFDQMKLAVNRIGQDYRLYTTPHFVYGLTTPNALQFRIGRVTPLADTPDFAIGIVQSNPNILDNLTQPGIWFRVHGSDIYAENADGANRTSTKIFTYDMESPVWLRWERITADIKFFMQTILYATHTTNLPVQTKNCVFAFQIRGVDNFTRTFAMTHPEFGTI